MSGTDFNNLQNANAYPDGMDFHYWHRARNQIIFHELKKLPERDLKILEIGCGRGHVMNALREKNVAIWGVEPSQAEPLVTVRSFIKTGITVDDIPLDERQAYNTLLLCDVLEHLPNPVEFLRSFRTLFPNVNAIVFTVPARPELWTNFDEFFGHYRRYTWSLCQQTVREAGGTIFRIRYFFRLLVPAILLTKLFWGKRKVEFKAPRSKISLFLNFLLARVLFLEYLIIPGRWVGSSLVCSYLCEDPDGFRRTRNK